MEINKCIKESFSVIGKEGSTNDGNGFVKRLWDDANLHFDEIVPLAKKDEAGNLLGIWGAMSDFSRFFAPWEEDFSKGLYLAGVEVENEAHPPESWVKWTIPSYEYIYVKNENQDTFQNVLKYMKENHHVLAGAVHDFNSPQDGQGFLYFPIKRF
jgi:hypothetical protein